MLTRSSLLLISAAMLYLGSAQSHAMPIDILLESDTDSGAGSELFLANFNDYQSLIDATVNSSSFSQVDLSSTFSVGGLAFDGSSYQLLLESDTDGGAGNDLFIATFDSYQNLLEGTVSSSSFSQLDLSSTFSSGGLAFDGSSYHLLLESDADSDAGSEVFLASFDSFQSLLDGTVASSSFSQLNISSNFSAGGFVAYAPEGPVEVSEPGSLGLLILGLGALMLRSRRAR